LVETFTTASIDNFTEEELHLKAGVDDSYVQMLKPFVCSKSKDVDRNLRKVRTNFEELFQDKKLSQDNAAFYLYEQIMPDKTVYRGLLCLTSEYDFWKGKIKKHGLAPLREDLEWVSRQVHTTHDDVVDLLVQLSVQAGSQTDQTRRGAGSGQGNT
jgi:uncharacterized protein (DUF1015 family)